MATQYLTTIEYVKGMTPITENVDSKHLTSFMTTAQDLKIMPHLGRAFMVQLLTQVATNQVIADATISNPVVITTDEAHGYATGDSVYISDATGMTGINGQWTITVVSATEFELDGLDGSAFSAYNVGSATAINMPAENVALLPYLLPAYSWWVLRDAIPFIYMHVTNSGIRIQGIAGNTSTIAEGGKAAEDDMRQWLARYAQGFAEQYTREMMIFLAENSIDYPLWNCSCTLLAPYQQYMKCNDDRSTITPNGNLQNGNGLREYPNRSGYRIPFR